MRMIGALALGASIALGCASTPSKVAAGGGGSGGSAAVGGGAGGGAASPGGDGAQAGAPIAPSDDVTAPFDPFATLRLAAPFPMPLPAGVAVRFGHQATGTGSPTHLAVSDDGARWALCSTSNDLSLWDATTGLPVKVLVTVEHACEGIGFTRDGKQLMVLDYEGLTTVDVARGTQLRVAFDEIGGGDFHGARLARGPRGQWLVAGCPEYGSASGLVIADLHVTQTLGGFGHDDDQTARCGTAIAMSPDGAWIAIGAEHEALLYHASSGEIAAHLPVYWAHDLVFTRDSRRVLAASGRAINAFDLETFDAVASYGFLGNRFFTESIALSRDGATLFSISDRNLVAFDVASGRERWTAPATIEASIATLPDGDVVAVSGAPRTIARWRADGTRRAPYDLARHDGPINSVAYFDEGRQVVTSGSDARLWKPDGTPLATFARRPSGYEVYAVPRPGADEIVSVVGSCALHAWSPTTRAIRLAVAIGAPETCRAAGIAVSPDGAVAAVTDARGALLLVELAHGGVIARVPLSPAPDTRPFFSDDGARVWLGAGTELLAIDIKTAAITARRSLGDQRPEGLTVLSAANLIVFGVGRDVRALALDTGKPRWTATITNDEFQVGSALDLAARGEIAVGVRGDVLRFDARTGQARGALRGGDPQYPALALALAPDGKRLLAAFPAQVIGWDL